MRQADNLISACCDFAKVVFRACFDEEQKRIHLNSKEEIHPY
jgi:hypothetical protein